MDQRLDVYSRTGGIEGTKPQYWHMILHGNITIWLHPHEFWFIWTLVNYQVQQRGHFLLNPEFYNLLLGNDIEKQMYVVRCMLSYVCVYCVSA